MGEVSTIGLDIAKSVFQVHGVDVAGAVVIRKRVRRAKVLEYFGELPPCLVGIEACPSAHHWGRELQALGHRVRLIPPSYVKAYLKRSKRGNRPAPGCGYLKILGAALQADGETRSVVTASSIRRRSAAWTILLDWTYRSRRPASALWMTRAGSCGK